MFSCQAPFVDCRKTARGGATQRRQVDFSSKKGILSAGPIKTFPELLSGNISYCWFSRSLLKITGGRSKQRVNCLMFTQTGSDIVKNRHIRNRRGKDSLFVCVKRVVVQSDKKIRREKCFCTSQGGYTKRNNVFKMIFCFFELFLFGFSEGFVSFSIFLKESPGLEKHKCPHKLIKASMGTLLVLIILLLIFRFIHASFTQGNS